MSTTSCNRSQQIHTYIHTYIHTGGVNVDDLLQSLIDLPAVGSSAPETRRETSDLTVVPASHALAVSMALRQEQGGDDARYACMYANTQAYNHTFIHAKLGIEAGASRR
jgi:hypothetical protein